MEQALRRKGQLKDSLMIGIEQYKQIVSDLLDDLPEAFFKDLSGGVIVSEAAVIPDYAVGNDLFTLGEYKFYTGVRQIVLYKGSFDRVYPQADIERARMILRGVVRHEFRHHLEYLGGIHDAGSLEAEDERKKRDYLDRHAEDFTKKPDFQGV